MENLKIKQLQYFWLQGLDTVKEQVCNPMSQIKYS